MAQQSNPKQRLDIIHQLAIELVDANSLQAGLDLVNLAIIEALQGFASAVFVHQPQHSLLICESFCNTLIDPEIAAKKLKMVSLGQGIVGNVAEKKQSLLVADTAKCEFYLSDIQANGCELCVPVLDQEQLLAVIDVEHAQAGFFNQDDVLFIETIASMVVALIVKHKSRLQTELDAEKLEHVRSKLSEKETYYRKLFEQSGDAIFIHDAKGRFLEFNEQAVLSLGYTRSELLNMKVTDIDAKVEMSVKQVEKIWADLKPGDSNIIRGCHRRKDGSTFPVEAKVSYLSENKIIAVLRDISYRDAIEGELEDTKSIIDDLLQTSSDIIYISSFEQNRIISGAENLSRALGYSKLQYPNWQTIYQSVHPDDLMQVKSREQKVSQANSSEIIQTEFRLANKSGDWVWFQNLCKVSKWDQQGNPQIEIGSFRDITELRQIKQRLGLNESYFQALVEHSHDGIVVHDELGAIKYASKSALRMLDYKESDVIGVLAREMVHPDDTEIPINAWKHVLNNPNQVFTTQEYRLRTKKGRSIWVSHTLNNLLNDPSVGAVISNFKSITEQKVAEQEVAKKEQYYRSLVENAFDGIVVYDEHASVKFISASVSNMLGYSAQDVSDKKGADFVHPEDLDKISQAWRWAMEHPGEPIRVPSYRLLKKNGEVIWVENTLNNLLGDVSVKGIISNFRDISYKKMAEKSIYKISNYDPLTELPNNRFLNQQLVRQVRQAERDQAVLNLVYFDIGQLNAINNSLGHQFGDTVLHKVAQAIRESATEYDLIARSGDDEFALLLYNLDSFETLKTVKKVLAKFRDEIEIDNKTVKVALRAGIARFPEDSNDAFELLSHAQLAAKTAKTTPDRYAFFKKKDSEFISQKLELEKELVKAIRENSLQLHYQPKVNLNTGEIVSCEALLRWHHPQKGMINPQYIINIAEESDLIHRLTSWVLNTAVEQIKAWKDKGLPNKIAVNLSPKDLLQKSLSGKVFELLDRYELEYSCLELEVTESATISDMQRSATTLSRLAEKGIGIALDDFGTGYSSISYLATLPVSLVKIDRSFIKELYNKLANSAQDKEAILKSIINLTHSFKMNSLAEGIETKEQLNFLKKLNCNYGQGYFFSKPLPVQELEPLLEIGKIDFEKL